MHQALFKGHIEEDAMKCIRETWQTGTPLVMIYFGTRVSGSYTATLNMYARIPIIRGNDRIFLSMQVFKNITY